MNIQTQRSTEIPGLFSSEQNKGNTDWSNDNASQEQAGADAAAGNDSQNNMILLRGKSLLTDLTLEKNSLDKGFVHSHRLLDAGEIIQSRCKNRS